MKISGPFTPFDQYPARLERERMEGRGEFRSLRATGRDS